MLHSIGYYAEGFNKAANESVEKGANFFAAYVRDHIMLGNLSAKDAFEVCINNIGNCDGVTNRFGGVGAKKLVTYKHKAIERARQLMAEELTQF